MIDKHIFLLLHNFLLNYYIIVYTHLSDIQVIFSITNNMAKIVLCMSLLNVYFQVSKIHKQKYD